jgi:surface polysaccharide O-acyltransferase-like enzyme
MSLNNNIVWIDNLRVLATISVIFLHVSCPLLYKFETNPNWWCGNIYDSIMRFCVPVFVMITGALLLPKEYDLKYFIKSKVTRIIFPFLFWSFMYLLFNLFVKKTRGENSNILDTFNFTLIYIKKGSSYHLWYVYMIIGIYLFIPIISKWIKICSEKEILYFLIIWVITIILNIPFINNFAPNFNLTYFSGYLGFLILGYYLSKKTFKNLKSLRQISILLFLTGALITIFGTYFLSSRNGFYSDFFHNFLTINVLIMAVGFFLYFKNLKINNITVIKIRNFISKYSYGIYLVHVLILTILYKIGFNFKLINPFIGIPIISLLCLIISSLTIHYMNKLPFGKYFAG